MKRFNDYNEMITMERVALVISVLNTLFSLFDSDFNAFLI